MSHRTYQLVERAIMALMIAGMVGMFQPLVREAFGPSFLVLLFSTIGFIIVSHITPK
jgi:hypothetical protein